MTTNEFIQTLDSIFAAGEYDRVEPFMLSALNEAKEKEDYGLYLSVGNEMIGYYRSVSHFQKAYQIAEDMLLLMEELQMDQSAEFATVLLNTATAYSFDGRFETALQFYGRAEQIYHLLVSPEDYLFAGLYNNMSSLMEKMGRDEEALALLMKALRILLNYPERQMEAATNFTNLGLLYLKTGDLESGRKCVLQAIDMFEKLDTPASHYSAALSALGEICYREKDYGQAIAWYGKTLEEIERHYGRNLAYAVVCENLANVCREAGDEAQGEAWCEKARKVREDLEKQNAAPGREGTGDWENERSGEKTEDRENERTGGKTEDREDIESRERTGDGENAGSKKETDSVEILEGQEGQKDPRETAKSEKMQGGRGKSGKALAGCRAYYERYGKPMLAEYPELQGHFAAGLVGEGSECFGYDDEISTDHDYFPRFFIWLDDWAYEKYGAALQEAYDRLPKSWDCVSENPPGTESHTEDADGVMAGLCGGYADTIMTPAAASRCGVCKVSDFYYRLLGRESVPQTMYDWILLQETRLATVTNGEVFEDNGGGFTAQRKTYLSYFPEDVRKKKLAARLRKMAQTGQYQYARCMCRGEHVAAQMALAEFVQNAGSACFLLTRQYMPYFKWMHRKMKELPVLSEVAGKLEELALLPSQQDKWDTEHPEKYRFSLNLSDGKVALIEEIAGMVAAELRKQGLARGEDPYLEPYAAEVEEKIEDPVLRAANLM